MSTPRRNSNSSNSGVTALVAGATTPSHSPQVAYHHNNENVYIPAIPTAYGYVPPTQVNPGATQQQQQPSSSPLAQNLANLLVSSPSPPHSHPQPQPQQTAVATAALSTPPLAMQSSPSPSSSSSSSSTTTTTTTNSSSTPVQPSHQISASSSPQAATTNNTTPLNVLSAIGLSFNGSAPAAVMPAVKPQRKGSNSSLNSSSAQNSPILFHHHHHHHLLAHHQANGGTALVGSSQFHTPPPTSMHAQAFTFNAPSPSSPSPHLIYPAAAQSAAQPLAGTVLFLF